MNTTQKTVVVGMSGGVDSSVAALLLKEQGYRVIGLFMKNWEEKDDQGVCQSAYEYEDVVRVCEQIGIPYYSVSFSNQYWDRVFKSFLDDCRRGLTPNPDILCNREIKFDVLLAKARELGGDYLATGHYCQVKEIDGHHFLAKGVDPGKDQSYFLHAINGKVLSKILFPIGALPKSEVRRIARENGLATSEKKDSTGICFIGKRNFKGFLSQYLGYQPGDVETTKGKVIGTHDGVAYHTIGQRKGLGIGGPGDAWFVVDKDLERNVVVVAQGTNHPALFKDKLVASNLTWIVPEKAPKAPFPCRAKIRYRQDDQECTITKLDDDRVEVSFAEPQRAVTPGQSVVFYDGNLCLGGAIIEQ